ncbi:hypothetical protein CY34DRAFT_803188 [Suillus luteus UH-Slu-Lm8-n1]|uniref:Unplaced genomic scaffold CY34scaffold_69, whole genome shotgun sequence n=1 Tax=Suillus luteus UH-Slu-Lm8-n1 TaxID=930992 RepID=A0A0D0AQD9_9AGAM|nr:hypothetical protein CY34DRAFT_803188 [Suillus luteus UH-Slu-Lm8-n1]
MEGVLNTMNDEAAGDTTLLHFDEKDQGLAIFLYEKFIKPREPEPPEDLEVDLLQALEEYLARHPPNEASSSAEDNPAEPSQDDSMEIGVPDDTQRCGWMDEITNQRCPQFVLAGLKAMLLHLNTAHNVSGSEKAPKECRWAVLRPGYESACGATFQRRNVPRHIAKHLGLRWICNLCDKSFARSDLLKSHRRKDHQAQDKSEIETKLQMAWALSCTMRGAPTHPQ